MLRILLAIFACVFLTPALAAPEAEHADHPLPPTPGEQADAATPDLQQAERIIRERTNAFRKQHGLPPVAPAEPLTTAAQEFATWMAEHQKYGHQADGRTPGDRVEAAGYTPCLVAENIAYQFNSVGFETEKLGESFFVGWRESPPHRANMLQADATQTGVGIAQNPESGKYFAVQLFGRPREASISFKITNHTTDSVRYRIGQRNYSIQPRYTMTHSECGSRTVVFLPPAPPGKATPAQETPPADALPPANATPAGEPQETGDTPPAPQPVAEVKVSGGEHLDLQPSDTEDYAVRVEQPEVP